MKKSKLQTLLILCLSLTSLSSFAASDAAIGNALVSSIRNEKLLETLQKRAQGTPKEHEILMRLIEGLIQVDRLSKQKELLTTAATKAVVQNAVYPKKLEYYTTRFLTIYPNDKKVFRVHSIRAKAREELGNVAGMNQDIDTVIRLAPHNSEEWLKASVRVGEFHRAAGNLAKSEEILNTALKSASQEWVIFILEALLQTQSQAHAYDRALVTINQIFVKQGKNPSPQTEGFMLAKGQVLGKLLIQDKISMTEYFREFGNYRIQDKIAILKTTMVELSVVNRENFALEIIKHPLFRGLDIPAKLAVTSDLTVLLYDQKSGEALQKLLLELETYGVVKMEVATRQSLETSLKRFTELSAKIQTAIVKDPKLAHQGEGRTLESLYSVIIKMIPQGDPIMTEAKFNKASLFVIQERFSEAYPLYRELGKYKDAEEKFSSSFILAQKKAKVIPETWAFGTKPSAPIANQAAIIQDLDFLSKKYCALEAFKEGFCFESMKGLVRLGKMDTLELELRPIVFDEKRTPVQKEQAFSALFDFFQTSHLPEKAAEILNSVEKKGVKLNATVIADAKKTVKAQTLVAIKKLFEQDKNEELLTFAKKFESENDQELFPELFAFTGVAAQHLSQDDVAQSYYVKFDQSSEGSKTLDPAIIDMVTVGHAIVFERALDYAKASFWWTKLKVWKDSAQKRLVLNSIWLSADMVKFKTLILTPGFCDRADGQICEEYKRLFVSTWPVFFKEYTFAKDAKPKTVLDQFIQIQLTDKKNPARLKWIAEMHDHWSSLDPVRQIALFPHFQKLLKDEIHQWIDRESEKWGKINNLMDFQAALKGFKKSENDLSPFAQSHWTDFQVYSDIAVGLVYDSLVSALDRSKTKDQAMLDSDPSIKKLFEDTTTQLIAKKNEILARGINRTQNYSMDLSSFESLTKKYPEWDVIAKTAVRTAPTSFFSNLGGKARMLKDHWLAAFSNYNWAKVGYCIVQFSNEKTIPPNVIQTFEAETFLRFGNRIDSQRTINGIFGMSGAVATNDLSASPSSEAPNDYQGKARKPAAVPGKKENQ